MKKLLRSAPAQAFLARLATLWIGLTLASMRWRFENLAGAEAFCAREGGGIACFWHGRIFHGVVCRRILKTKPTRVLISLSRDGEFIARAVTPLGFPPIRGSSARSARASAKGGAAAFIEAARFIRSGGVVAITPDGPRGPVHVLPKGPVQLARTAREPVMLFGLAARPAINLNTWDRTQIPLPFARGCVIFVGPLPAPPSDASDEAMESIRRDWEAQLVAAQDRAEAVLAGRAPAPAPRPSPAPDRVGA
ncbi:MAG: lysophospholipid acyltransferase family protein [Caulobacteraceae bacterium]|nr:lysophospholipid acyltransferase family protein [Caulobacteraceae bacterium]